MQMAIRRDTLWLADGAGDPYVHVVDLIAGRFLVSYGQNGEGPGDFESLVNLTTRPGEAPEIWAFDANLRRITRLGVGVGSEHPATMIMSPTALLNRAIWLNPDRLLVVAHSDTDRYAILDSTGKRLAVVPGDLLGPDSVDKETRAGRSTGFYSCASPPRERFAVAFVHGGRIDLNDYSGRLRGRARVPFPTKGSFRRDSVGQWHARDVRLYYVDCAATPPHLYALFSGLRLDRPGGAVAVEARYVHVFDWDGNLVTVLALDRFVRTIATAGDTLLYAAASDASGVYRYKLPDWSLLAANGQEMRTRPRR
jgi:hypothetical protein